MFYTTSTLVLCIKINVCSTAKFEVLQMLSVTNQCHRALEANTFNQINVVFHDIAVPSLHWSCPSSLRTVSENHLVLICRA